MKIPIGIVFIVSKDIKNIKNIKEEKKAAAPQEVFPPGIETQEELEALKARLRE